MIGVSDIIMVIASLLLVAGMLQFFAQRMNVPHTVLLAAAGLVVGFLALWSLAAEEPWLAGELLAYVVAFEISSETFIDIFVPTLLFQAALTISARRLLDDIGPIFVLSVVAVVVSTLAIGYGLAAASEIALTVCLLIGAIVATTDPSAVVGLFRDTGAPQRLGILIEGESILNDAAAIALFGIFLELLLFQTLPDPGSIALAFSYDVIGGLAVGLIGAWFACLVLARLHGIALAEVTVTVALAYMVYVAAEHYVDASGVVAVVTAGFFIGWYGRTRIGPDSWDYLNRVWSQLSYWASALVFLLAAMSMPRRMVDVGWHDVILLLVVIGCAFAARGAVLVTFFPILARLGWSQHVSPGYMAAIWWGGVRGALTLALALAVTEHPQLDAHGDVRATVATLATGFVLFTLFVNATTLPVVMRWLKLDRLNRADQIVRDRAIELALEKAGRDLEDVAEQYRFEGDLLDREADRLRKRRDALREAETPTSALSVDDQVYVGLSALVAAEGELYRAHFSDQILSRYANRTLTTFVARLSDATKTGHMEGYRTAAERVLELSPWLRPASFVHRHLRLGAPLAYALARRYELLRALRIGLLDVIALSRERVASLVGEAAVKEIAAVLQHRYEDVQSALMAIELQYPEYTQHAKTEQLRRIALRFEERAYRRLFEDSIVGQDVFDALQREWRKRWARSQRRVRLDVMPPTAELVARVPLFQGLTQAQRLSLTALLRARLAMPNEALVNRGDRGDSMFFVLSGTVEVRNRANVIELGAGDFFGEIALMLRERRTADVVATGYCELLELRGPDFRGFLSGHPDLEAEILDTARARLRENLASQ